jgi:hypothetical protein
MQHRLAVLTLALVISVAGCLADRAPSGQPQAKQSASTPAAAKRGPALMIRGATRRKIIRDGKLHVRVERYAPARAAIDSLLAKSGGYVSKARVQHHLGQVSHAELVLRVPAGRFAGAMAALARLGTVIAEGSKSRDVTEQYVDLQARLKNAKRLEKRLLELLDKRAAVLADVLKVETQLSRVREQIERYHGKLKQLDGLINLSTLRLTLSIRQVYASSTPPSFGADASSTLGASWRSLLGFGRGLMLGLIALLPWLLPLGAAGYGSLRLVRRWRRRRAAARQSAEVALVSAAGGADRSQ